MKRWEALCDLLFSGCCLQATSITLWSLHRYKKLSHTRPPTASENWNCFFLSFDDPEQLSSWTELSGLFSIILMTEGTSCVAVCSMSKSEMFKDMLYSTSNSSAWLKLHSRQRDDIHLKKHCDEGREGGKNRIWKHCFGSRQLYLNQLKNVILKNKTETLRGSNIIKPDGGATKN